MADIRYQNATQTHEDTVVTTGMIIYWEMFPGCLLMKMFLTKIEPNRLDLDLIDIRIRVGPLQSVFKVDLLLRWGLGP